MSGEMDRRRFLARMAGVGAAVLVPGVPGWARAAARELTGHPETARAWRAMGTLIEVRVPDLPPAEAVAAIRLVRRRVEELEAAMTLYRPESPLVGFNSLPEGRWTRVPAELLYGVTAACDACAGSSGLFDPTVAPAMRAWGLYDLRGRVPSEKFLREWSRRPGASAVEVDRAGRRMRRLDSRVEVDLGGVGKGIAVDEALAILARAGSGSSLVNLGGSIGVLGPPPWNAEGWPVGIADPSRPGEILTELSLSEGHLATSGVYERSVSTPEGRKHHLLDPVTGEPTERVDAVTVWCERGVEADLQSTVEFLATARKRSGMDAGEPQLFPRRVVSLT